MDKSRATVQESSALLKATLQRAFPATKFSVRLGRGTGWGSVHVSWTDGPTEMRVKPILAQFEGKNFDGSDDSTVYTHVTMPDGRESALGYVLHQRDISPAFARRVVKAVAAHWRGDLIEPPAIIDKGRYWELESWTVDRSAEKQSGRTWSALIREAANNRLKVTR